VEEPLLRPVRLMNHTGPQRLKPDGREGRCSPGAEARHGWLGIGFAAHRMPPALLLMFTFVLGTGAILVAPAYQSLVPEMVPRRQVPAAAALSSININLARAIGPAIAGLLVARVGVAAVFGLNTATSCYTRS
jgi:MFS family permease